MSKRTFSWSPTWLVYKPGNPHINNQEFTNLNTVQPIKMSYNLKYDILRLVLCLSACSRYEYF